MKLKTIIFCFALFLLSFGAQSQLVFQNIDHDYGRVNKAKSLLSEFIVTNTGTEDAVILRIDAGNNFAFKLDQIIIKPGQSDTLKLFLKPTRAGKFDEEVSVFLSSQDKPIILHIKGDLKEVDKDPLGQCFSFRESHPDVYKALAITDQRITVLDKATNKPIEGAFIQLFNSDNKSYFEYTKSNGEIALTVQPNMYDVQVRADFYKSTKSEIYLSKDARINILLEKTDDQVITPTEPKKDTSNIVVAVKETIAVTPRIDTIIPVVNVVKIDTVKPILEPVKPVDTVKIVEIPKPEMINGELNPEVFAPSNVVFLIDLSSSMNEPAKLPLLKKSMKTLISTMRSIDRITIVVYAESSRIILPTTQVIYKDSIYKLIDGLKASGLTAANKALRTAYEINNKSFILGGNNQIILATDGMFNLSKMDEEMMVNYANAPNKIILSVVAFGNSTNAKSKLSNMASNGKGDYLDIANESVAQQALLNEIKSKSKR
ncbi:MAG: VWA domain-containing protein [Bacteroidetes bacterium]|nr:VWA domain-containing protein [Bacteroidota bacterium]